MSPPPPGTATASLSGLKFPAAPRAPSLPPLCPPVHPSVHPSVRLYGSSRLGSPVAPVVPVPRDATGTRSQPRLGTEVTAGRGASPGVAGAREDTDTAAGDARPPRDGLPAPRERWPALEPRARGGTMKEG